MNLFDIASKEKASQELEIKTQEADFWSDTENSTKVLQEIKVLKNKVSSFKSLDTLIQDTKALIELGIEEKEESIIQEVKPSIKQITKSLEKLEIANLLSGKHDASNAIITIHPGAGGTESQDWAEMLYRMYSMWADKNGYKLEELDYLEGDVAGIKSVTFSVTGDNAYGYLKGESGVHRLVRISPFDSAGRRHTSFASVEVIPEVSDDLEVQIDPNDLKVDTYRSSGAGGQHVNKTSSAVRLIHIPTGMIAECQTERSQVQNREYAMRMLKSRLYEEEKAKQDAEVANARKSQVGSGDRSEKIRTYNYPQGRITDHRIGMSVFQFENFLNGDIDELVDSLIAADRAEKLKGEEE